VLDTPVAREVLGDAAVFVAHDDIAAPADALRALLTQPDLRARIVARGAPVLRRYSWESAAARTLEHLERVAPR
jgi:glycosyltransferase involved in cell wall biosynthesis